MKQYKDLKKNKFSWRCCFCKLYLLHFQQLSIDGATLVDCLASEDI